MLSLPDGGTAYPQAVDKAGYIVSLCPGFFFFLIPKIIVFL